MSEDLQNMDGALDVLGLGLWLPGWPSLAAWRAGERGDADEPPRGAGLKPMLRRRASALGRALADASAEASAAASVDASSTPAVIGSSIGEAATLVRLLEQLWRAETPMSPADFSVSVHNAASGVMSISAGNRGFTTSIAADFDTPAAALYEALGLVVADGMPVLVACGDEGAPMTLLDPDRTWAPLAAALVVGPPGAGARPIARIRLEPARSDAASSVDPAPLPQELGRNPQAGLVDLVHALGQTRGGAVRLDRGAGRGFRAVFEAGDAR